MKFVLCTFVGERYMVGTVDDNVDLSDKSKRLVLNNPITVHISMQQNGAVQQNLLPAYLIDSPQESIFVEPQTIEVLEDVDITSTNPQSKLLSTYLGALQQKKAQRAGITLAGPSTLKQLQNHGKVLPMKKP
jgi:hypothetical protein